MRQPQGSARYGGAHVAPVSSSNGKEGIPALEERIDEIMDRVARVGDDHVERAAVLPLRPPNDVWIYVQAGIEYSDMGGYAEALDWLTAGLGLALRTGDPESALEQLRPLRASCLSALGRQPDDIREPAARREHK